MKIVVERDTARDGRPVYRQIAEQVAREIADGRRARGSRLPPIRDLARTLRVNRDTVALAYDALASAGLVESTVGRGTFVRRRDADGPVGAAPGEIEFSPLTQRLLDLERARPRFGSDGDAIPMHTLVPDPGLYPADEFRRVLGRVLQREGAGLLHYGDPRGHAPLRDVVAERLRSAGIDVTSEGVVLCHGASQGIHLATRVFAQPGDAVALEEPTYNNVLSVMRGLGLRPVPVPLRSDGADLESLARVLERPEVKFFYSIPTFHNPVGITTGVEHRRAVLDIAARCRKPVLEDGYEMDLRLGGRAVPPLAALDDGGWVVHLFSFSKSLFPGARVGAISAHGRIVDALLALKQSTDLADSMLLQAALAEFVRDGSYERHLRKLRRELCERRDAMLAALGDTMPAGVHWTEPEGGYQVWVDLPSGLDTGELLADAVGAGVLFAPGFQFHHDGRPSHCLRLSYAMAGAEALRRGVEILAGLVRARLEDGTRSVAAIHI